MDNKLKCQGGKADIAVTQILSELGSNYSVFNNVILSTKKGAVYIEYVVVSQFGVFVIETQQQTGQILGDFLGRNWVQLLVCGDDVERHQFPNPYLQNVSHLKSLYSLFGVDSLGLIVFTDSSVDVSKVHCPNVIYVEFLHRMIKGYKQVLLTDEQVLYLCNNLPTSRG